MPKTFNAKKVTSVNPLQWVWEAGECVGLLVNAEVNYGEMSITHQVDIWEDLTPEQKEKAVAIYQFVKAKVEQSFLGE